MERGVTEQPGIGTIALSQGREEFKGLQRQIVAAEVFQRDAQAYASEAGEQVMRLQSIRLFDRADGPHRCPVCSSDLPVEVPTVSALRTWVAMAREKAQADEPRGPKYRCAGAGADCFVVAVRRGNARGAKGAGHQHRDRKGQRVTGGTRWCRWKAAAFNGWHEPCESRGSSTVL